MASPRIIAETLYNEFEKKLAKSDEIDSFWHYQELKPIQKAHSKVKEVEGAPDTILLGDLVQSDEKGNENKKIISLLKRQAVLAEPKAGELTLEKKIEVAKASIEKLRNPDENNKVIQERLKQLQSATENARNDFNSFKNDNEKIIKSIEEQIRPIADEVKPIEDTIKQKENEIKQKEDEIKQKENEIKQKVGAIKKKEYDINNIKINIQKLEKNISARSSSKKNQDLTNQVVMLEAKLVKLQEEKKALAIIIKPIIKPMQDQKKLMQENVKQMQEQVKPLQEQVKPLQEQLKSMHVQVNRIKDQVARKKLVFAEAQWEEKKATTDPNEIIKSERSKQLKILTALESDQKIKKQGVLTINDLKQIADFQEAAKNRAEKHTAIIHRFIELKYPELTDPKTKFHYSAEISAEYKRNANFRSLVDASLNKSITANEIGLLNEFEKWIQVKIDRRIKAYDFTCNSNRQTSYKYNSDHKSLFERAEAYGPLKPPLTVEEQERLKPLTADEQKRLIELEMRVNSNTEDLLRGIDFSKEVNIKIVEAGATFLQSQSQGSTWVGRFDITPGKASSPQHLGISSFTNEIGFVFSTSNIGEKDINTFRLKSPVEVMESYAAPVIDSWSTSVGVRTEGGGLQLFSPDTGPMERISNKLQKELKQLERSRTAILTAHAGELTGNDQNKLDILDKQISDLKELIRENAEILEKNKIILAEAETSRLLSTKVSDEKATMKLHVLDHVPTPFELKSYQLINSYVLVHDAEKSSWNLYSVMRDTMEPIDLHQKKSELLSANNPRRPATQATKAADNAANDAYKAVLKDLETINTELKDKTPTNLSLANQVSIRKALISYETNSKEVLNNITTNVHAPKSMAHIFSRLDVKPAVIQKQLVESKKERKKLAISIPSNNIIAPATPSPVSGNTSSIPETPTSSISGTPSPTSSVQPSSPGLNSPTAEIDSPRNTSPKP